MAATSYLTKHSRKNAERYLFVLDNAILFDLSLSSSLIHFVSQ